jgi:hypothetical protein
MIDFNIADMVQSVGDSTTTQVILTPQDTASRDYGPDKDGHTFCGPKTISIPQEQLDALGPAVTWDPDTGTLTFQTDDHSLIGEFPLDITVSLDNYPEVSETASIIVDVEPCEISSFEAGSDISSLDYIIGQEEITYDQGFTFTQTNNCVYPETIDVTGLPPFVTYNDADRSFVVDTDAFEDADTYPITVQSTITVPIDQDGNTREEIAEFTFDLVVEDPCDSTTFLGELSDVSTINHSVNGANEDVIVLDKLQDQASIDYGDNSGLTYCGDRSFTATIPEPADGSAAPFTIEITDTPEATEFKVTGDYPEPGEYTFEVTLGLDDYTGIEKTQQFTIQVEPCVPEILVVLSPDASYDYTIFSGPDHVAQYEVT